MPAKSADAELYFSGWPANADSEVIATSKPGRMPDLTE
jgi:hypothetical protein